MPKRGAQECKRLIANIRRDVGSRLELLDAGFHALDGAVGGFDRFVATRGRCGTRCRNGSLRRRICLGRSRCLRGRRRFFRRRHGLCCRRHGLGRCRCLSVTRHGHRQQSKQERAASQFQTGEYHHGAEVAALLVAIKALNQILTKHPVIASFFFF